MHATRGDADVGVKDADAVVGVGVDLEDADVGVKDADVDIQLTVAGRNLAS
jgi:hypothetical protein